MAMKLCFHTLIAKGFCCFCGADLTQPLVPEPQTQEDPFEYKKLTLFVDLDHTLIHSTRHKDLKSGKSVVRTSIRPHCIRFLESMSKLYEMHVITLAGKGYAQKIVKELDPEERFFGGRLIARNKLGSTDCKTKKLRKLFPSGLKYTAIIDDRWDVWDYMDNVVQVRMYECYWRPGDPGKPKEDDVLLHMERVLTEVHQRFYSNYETSGEFLDLKAIIGEYRRSVLKSVRVVLSGREQMEEDKKTAVTDALTIFGAELQATVTSDTTVVIEMAEDKKIRTQAEGAGVPVVGLHWLRAVTDQWKRVDFDGFMLGATVPVEEKIVEF
ncbi:hypothetical protein QR680_007859 [Steinernema hermaphroditum]|uniref:protein-serine/threonine phosphatase n=1 Tax=Steinernema hermaphroditum TaxID=289476 RepID=A0AA39IEG1_9BILA|nr:hypothetical protein QR680_007859 [Steinernema hermaphroditum]